MDQGFKNQFPDLFTPESIQRKMQISFEVLKKIEKLQEHALTCKINTFKDDCEICDNLTAFSNAILVIERGMGKKLDVDKIIEFYEKYVE